MEKHLAAHDVKLESEIRLSPMLTFDDQQETFVGANSDVANTFLKRQYRAPYVVSEIDV